MFFSVRITVPAHQRRCASAQPAVNATEQARTRAESHAEALPHATRVHRGLHENSSRGAVGCSRMLYGPSSVALSDRALARKRTGDEAGSGARPVVRKSLVP